MCAHLGHTNTGLVPKDFCNKNIQQPLKTQTVHILLLTMRAEGKFIKELTDIKNVTSCRSQVNDFAPEVTPSRESSRSVLISGLRKRLLGLIQKPFKGHWVPINNCSPLLTLFKTIHRIGEMGTSLKRQLSEEYLPDFLLICPFYGTDWHELCNKNLFQSLFSKENFIISLCL